MLRIFGGSSGSPCGGKGPLARTVSFCCPGGETAWRAARDDLAAAQKELEQAVAALKPDDLLRWIGDQRDPSLGTGLPVGTVVRGLMQHHAYHEGQISLLKRASTSGPQRRKA